MTDALQIRPLQDRDIEAVISLWQAAGLTRPHNDPRSDIEFARMNSNSEILVGELDGEIVASTIVGHDGHRGVIYYLSVHPDKQGMGLGREILEAAESWLQTRGVWKLNLMIREGNDKVQGFYEAAGYETEPRTVMAKWLDPSKRG